MLGLGLDWEIYSIVHSCESLVALNTSCEHVHVTVIGHSVTGQAKESHSLGTIKEQGNLPHQPQHFLSILNLNWVSLLIKGCLL